MFLQFPKIAEPTLKEYTIQLLQKVQPNLEPLPDLAPEWDGRDEEKAVKDSGEGVGVVVANTGVDDAVVPVKGGVLVKKEGGVKDSKDVQETKEMMNVDKKESEDKHSRMLCAYQVKIILDLLFLCKSYTFYRIMWLDGKE